MSGPTPSIQYSWDGPGTLGAPDAGLYMRWNNATARFEMAAVTVPSTLDDLSDVTVTGAAQGAVLYRNASAWVHLPAGSSGQALLSGGAGANPAWGSAGVSDHGGLTGLADDDHTQYALLAGRAGGQTLIGGTASGEGLTLTSTSHATKGVISFNGGLATINAAGEAQFASTVYLTSTAYGVIRSGTSVALFTGSGSRLSVSSVGVNFLSHPVVGNSAAVVPLTIQLAASQTANAFEVKNSAATVLTFFDQNGYLRVGSATGTQISTQIVKGHNSAAFLDSGSAANGWQFRDTSSGVKFQFNNTGIGFFAATPVARAAALTQTYSTADRTLSAYTPDAESVAYTGIDNAQAGAVYATVADLNALRVAVENLRAFAEDHAQFTNSIVDDMQAYGLEQ